MERDSNKRKERENKPSRENTQRKTQRGGGGREKEGEIIKRNHSGERERKKYKNLSGENNKKKKA